MSTQPPVFPAFLLLSGRRVLVVGGGPVAGSKLAALKAAGAKITLVAPELNPLLDLDGVEVHQRFFRHDDLDGAWFVVAAAPPEVNRDVARAAEERRIFVNAVDDKASATAFLGGVVRKGDVTVAISTGGGAPALAGLVREGLEALLPDDLARWTETASELRDEWKARRIPMPERRPLLLEAINGLYPGGRS